MGDRIKKINQPENQPLVNNASFLSLIFLEFVQKWVNTTIEKIKQCSNFFDVETKPGFPFIGFVKVQL